jgi:hypothetical protein
MAPLFLNAGMETRKCALAWQHFSLFNKKPAKCGGLGRILYVYANVA